MDLFVREAGGGCSEDMTVLCSMVRAVKCDHLPSLKRNVLYHRVSRTVRAEVVSISRIASMPCGSNHLIKAGC